MISRKSSLIIDGINSDSVTIVCTDGCFVQFYNNVVFDTEELKHTVLPHCLSVNGVTLR